MKLTIVLHCVASGQLGKMKSFIAFFALVCFVVVVSDLTDASEIQDSAESKDICCFGCVNCKTELNENKDICCDVCYICKDHEGVHQSHELNPRIFVVSVAMKSLIVSFALVCFAAMMLESTNASPIQDSGESKDICCFGCVNCKTELNETKDICCDVCYICKDHEGIMQMKSCIVLFALVCFAVMMLESTNASPIQDSAESKDICCFGCVNCKTELNENKDICCDVCYICKNDEGVQSVGFKMFLARISSQ
ncbi:unnamed protein product [Notodromas monacha]|uniref:Uncharacterized protein n=1 Tax=Notodromas monacha TaxID=399045 RepID=A0A7R9BUW2_9CRUS|nr:unnamed protein product [Notodromas monacha]CAG0922164.1 unnamed protein product [Notodromas monacha]